MKINKQYTVGSLKMIYQIVRIERINDTVFRDDFKYDTIEEAKTVYEKEKAKPIVMDIRLFEIIDDENKKELCRFVRHKKSKIK